MAFSNNYTVNVDIKTRMSNIVPTYKQGETAVLKFKVFDNNKLFDFTDFTRAEIVFRLPSGESVVGEALLVDGLITYYFTGVEMAEVGRVQTLLSIYSGTTMVAVQPFIIHIYDSMKNQDLSYIGILQDLIAEVQLLEKTVEGSLVDIDSKIAQLDGAVLAEQTRESNETQRKLNETERITKESERNISESKRVSDEAIRVSNENQRIVDENLRLSTESARQLKEDERIINETERVNSETTRKASESERVINEGIRASAELTRDSNEAQRKSDESARNLSESQRISSESTRESNETARISAESQRVLDETTRKSNEQTRINNEVSRNSTFDTKVSQVNQAITDGNNFLTSSTHKREYSPLTQYYKNNEVLYNGSTWRCMQDCISVTPTEGVNWTLVAQRGIDGTGSVSSVNGISPDLSGNVNIDATSLGGVTQEVFAAHANNTEIHVTKLEKDKLATIESGAQINKVNSVNGQTGDVIVQGFSGNYSDLTGTPTEFKPTTHSHSISQVTGLQTELSSKYEKPLTGIPSTDLTSTVQTSLGKADTALQSVPDASTTTKGIVKLNDTLTSISANEALTANKGKDLSDKIDDLTGNLGTTNDNLIGLDSKVTQHLTEYSTLKTAINTHLNQQLSTTTLVTEPFNSPTTTTVNLGFRPDFIIVETIIRNTKYESYAVVYDGIAPAIKFKVVESDVFDIQGGLVSRLDYNGVSVINGVANFTATGLEITWTVNGTLPSVSGNRRLMITAFKHGA